MPVVNTVYSRPDVGYVACMSIDSDPTVSPYLTGIFAPVDDELDVADLPVHGTLPAALSGSYLRNGPNAQFPPIGKYHIFDGDGMVHGLEIRDGKARYRNRWVESQGLLAERAHGKALFGGLSEFRMPDADVVAEAGLMKNTSNTHLIRNGGKLLSLMEASRPTELTNELATVGEYDFGGKLQGPMTAHPKIDPATGEMVFFGYSPLPPYLRLHVADADGNLVRSNDIELPAPVMMHDFAVSARRVVFFDLPAVFDLPALLAGGEGIRWDPANGARIGVIDRDSEAAEVQWIEVEPFYVFHFLNATDDGDAVVVTGCRSPRLNVGFGPDTVVEDVYPTLHRWRIDTATGTVADEQLDYRPGDFPRINDNHAGLANRYGYVAHSGTWGDNEVLFNGLVKHDFANGTSDLVTYGSNVSSGEASFAPDPTRTDEDAGWLLNFVHDLDTDTSNFVVLDAQSLDEVARVPLPRRVPVGFHGAWFVDED